MFAAANTGAATREPRLGDRGVLPRGPAAGEVDPVDVALARALADASNAGRFDVVLQLAKELEARRLERGK
jgi:hypothetical protein